MTPIELRRRALLHAVEAENAMNAIQLVPDDDRTVEGALATLADAQAHATVSLAFSALYAHTQTPGLPL